LISFEIRLARTHQSRLEYPFFDIKTDAMETQTPLQGLVDRTITDVRKALQLKSPKTDKALIIQKIAPNSPASLLGLTSGDFLLSLNDGDGVSCDKFEQAIEEGPFTYCFYLASNRQLLTFRSNGIPLGIVVQQQTASIIKNYSWLSGKADDIYEIWKRYEDQAITQLVETWSEKGRFKWENRKIPRFLRRVFGLTPLEKLFAGIGFYEAGSHEIGIDFIEEYLNDHIYDYTVNYGAVAMHYIALEYRRCGDTQKSVELMEEAYEYCSLDRIANKLKMYNGKLVARNQSKEWLGKKFPIDYSLPIYEQAGECRLSETLGTLQAHQVLVICLLGPYRSNGPYDEFMNAFIRCQRYFDNIIAGLHVCTSAESNTHWLKHENIARKKGLPFHVLHDEDDTVSEAVDTSLSTDIYILDKDGIVVSASKLNSEIELWALIEARTNIALKSTN